MTITQTRFTESVRNRPNTTEKKIKEAYCYLGVKFISRWIKKFSRLFITFIHIITHRKKDEIKIEKINILINFDCK